MPRVALFVLVVALLTVSCEGPIGTDGSAGAPRADGNDRATGAQRRDGRAV